MRLKEQECKLGLVPAFDLLKILDLDFIQGAQLVRILQF